MKKICKKTTRKRLIANVLALTVAVSVCGVYFKTTVTAGEPSVALRNPRVLEDDSMQAGKKVTYDCIYFGSYPQAEVIESLESYEAVKSKYLDEGDIIEDKDLYQALSEASDWDENSDITYQGDRYHRIKSSDATFVCMYVQDGNYQWGGVLSDDTIPSYETIDSDTYHYFKYEPIKWRVLSVEDNIALLLADAILDDQTYNKSSTDATWEKATIRSWLNGYSSIENTARYNFTQQNFIDAAFTSTEQQNILTTTVVNTDSAKSGNDTEDKIFLLSRAEVKGSNAVIYGFSEDDTWNAVDEAGFCKISVYAKAMGTSWQTYGLEGIGNGDWWLRSHDGYDVSVVTDDSTIADWQSYLRYVGVRPALMLDLTAEDCWSTAGVVCTDGTLVEPEGGMEIQHICAHKTTVIENVKAATCTETGYTGDIYCASCGELLEAGSMIAATGHSWDEGVVTKVATETETGIKTYTCKNDSSHTKTEEIPAKGISTTEQPTTTEQQDVPASTEQEDAAETLPADVGTTLTDTKTKAKYKVTSASAVNPTVAYIKCSSSTATSVTIPASVTVNDITYKVTSIAASAFKNNKKLTKVTIGKNVTMMGANSFSGCSKLKTVTLSSSSALTAIGEKAFYQCTALTKITIPAKVKTIGKQVFYGCKKLKTVTIQTTKLTTKTVGAKAFSGIYAQATIKVPKSKLSAYKTLLKKKGITGKKQKIQKS